VGGLPVLLRKIAPGPCIVSTPERVRCPVSFLDVWQGYIGVLGMQARGPPREWLFHVPLHYTHFYYIKLMFSLLKYYIL
jgi:hypothetical protein